MVPRTTEEATATMMVGRREVVVEATTTTKRTMERGAGKRTKTKEEVAGGNDSRLSKIYAVLPFA